MRYAIWNNKGGVGKSFLSFILGTEIAKRNPDGHVILVDMCPQANLSEVVLGGNGAGSQTLTEILADKSRKTIGGYFDERIDSPHKSTGTETEYLLNASQYNNRLPSNLFLMCGDPSLEIQAQVINQIGGQTLPENSWKNVHRWLLDLVIACQKKFGQNDSMVFIDCNPSFSAYTELAMMAADRLIVPCSSDGSSARAVTNIGALLYGVGREQYKGVSFASKSDQFKMALPAIHSVLLNRSTQYNKKASKAFKAMFGEIKNRVKAIQEREPSHVVSGGPKFFDIPDTHSVAIVCSHHGLPLYDVQTRKYAVHDTNPQVNSGPLQQYKNAIRDFLSEIID